MGAFKRSLFQMNVYVKNFKRFNTYSDLYNKEAYELELDCYYRLSKYKNFPSLIDYNSKDLTITLEHCGVTVRHIKDNNGIINKKALTNIKNIITALQTEDIVHLDFKAKNPKNLCYKDPNIFLIDFDVAIIDKNPLNSKLNHWYQKWLKHGGYNHFERQLEKCIKEFIK